MITKRLSRKMSSAPGSSLTWSTTEYKIQEFPIKRFPLPQIVRVKRDASKSSIFKPNTELILHDSRSVKKIEGCIVSERETFVIPYDCPAKVHQLSKAEEYKTISELREALPTCRFVLVTRDLNNDQEPELKRGQILTIVFKKNIGGKDVFTCQRKKMGEVQIAGKSVGGFAPMATTQEKRINEFIRHYSTFPVGIGLTESTLTNPTFNSLNKLVSSADSLLIRLTKFHDTECFIASSMGKRKTIYCVPDSHELTVTIPKALLGEDKKEHDLFCKEQHETVDMSLVTSHLNLQVSLDTEDTHTLHSWSYGKESTYDEVVPLSKSETKHDEKIKKIKSDSKSNLKDNLDEKSKAKLKANGNEKDKDEERLAKKKAKEQDKLAKEKVKKEKDKEKELAKEKDKEKKAKEKLKQKEKAKEKEKISLEPSSKPASETAASELLEDSCGYLIPKELLGAQGQGDVKILEGEYEIPQDAEKSPIASSFGRLMGKVKPAKDKKKERPASEIVMTTNKSVTMPALSNRKAAVGKNKAKTLSTIDVDMKVNNRDELDGGSVSPDDKKKGMFATAGKKAGAKLRQKLGKSKHIDHEVDAASCEGEGGVMYVTPIDQHDSSTTSATLADRPLPEMPPDDDLHKKLSTVSIPYDDDDELYDEIDPVPNRQFKIPKDLSKLNVEGVCDVLRYLNMAQHVPKFRRDQIDGEIFKSLDDQLLGALGVADPIQRLKLKKLLKGWRPKTA